MTQVHNDANSLHFFLYSMDNLFENGCDFPSEIMINIISRIDAVFVFCMRVVSKNWHGSIKDKKFIIQHNNLAKLRDMQQLVTCQVPVDRVWYNVFYTMSKDYLEEEQWIPFSINPSVPHMHRFDFIGSIDGLSCLQYVSVRSNREYVICNPVTGQHCTTTAPTPITNKRKFFTRSSYLQHLFCNLNTNWYIFIF